MPFEPAPKSQSRTLFHRLLCNSNTCSAIARLLSTFPSLSSQKPSKQHKSFHFLFIKSQMQFQVCKIIITFNNAPHATENILRNNSAIDDEKRLSLSRNIHQAIVVFHWQIIVIRVVYHTAQSNTFYMRIGLIYPKIYLNIRWTSNDMEHICAAKILPNINVANVWNTFNFYTQSNW